MLGKHFALLGSTGTGKSTSAALILHRICEAAPDGHIVMVDPHGEYASAFRNTGMILDVSNLQMPYWIMNFEEHCEVFLTSEGSARQVDADILAKCLLKARQKSRLAEHMGTFERHQDRFVGASAEVVQRVDGERGQVRIGREVWSARSMDGVEVLEAGATVTILQVTGAAVLVTGRGELPPS